MKKFFLLIALVSIVCAILGFSYDFSSETYITNLAYSFKSFPIPTIPSISGNFLEVIEKIAAGIFNIVRFPFDFILWLINLVLSLLNLSDWSVLSCVH